MSIPQKKNGKAAEALCLACGMCCNGVIFADVKLQPGEDAGRLRELGLRFGGGRGAPRFTQSCAAFEGCRCRIYAERPQYCREFECVLLKRVKAGQLASGAALRVIRTAHKRAAEVRRLLRELGEENEQVSLNIRFRRTTRRVEEQGLDERTAELYGQLTLAMQDLHVLLAEAFYPGAD